MATLSKEDIELFNFIINDPESGEAEKKIAKEVLAKNTPTKEIPTKVESSAKKPATKEATSKKPSEMTMTDLEKKKKALLKKVGKTEEECEKIISQYRALKSEKKTQVKKETARKVVAKKRTTKLKKEGKTIQGTTEKNVEATLDTASKKVVQKIDKEVDKIEKTSKTEKQVEKKISSLVTQAVRSNKKLLSDTAKELAKVSKSNAKQYLMSLKKEIDTLLSKYADGGTLPTPFGQAGLVGETGTLNEVDLFAMGGTLPQGVHQYYAQTYNPAYPTPHGYAEGGNVEDGKVYELKAYFVDVEKDSYDEGVLDSVQSWDSGDMGNYELKKFNSKQDLYNQLSRIIYRDTDKYPKKEFYGMDEDSDGNVTLTYDTMCAYKNDVYVVPSDLEVSLWKQGEMELFNVRHFFVVDVYKKERLEFAKGGMTTSEQYGNIIGDLKNIQSEVTDRPPYVFERDGQLFVSSEEGDEFSDYYGEYYEPMYIDERLETIAEKNGGYWEWEDAGSIVFVDDSFAKGGKLKPIGTYSVLALVDGFDEAKQDYDQVYYKTDDYVDITYYIADLKNEGEYTKDMQLIEVMPNGKMRKFNSSMFAKGGITEKDKESLRKSGFSEAEIKDADEISKKGSDYAQTRVNPFFNTYAKGGIFAEGRVILADGKGIGGNKNKTYQLIKFDYSDDGTNGFEVKEMPTNLVMAQGNNFEDVLNTFNLFTGKMAKGGKTQGYNDRLDESLGNRNSVEPLMMQSYKDRRDESKGMEKSMGRRPYSSVGTMDKMAKGGKIGFDGLARKVAKRYEGKSVPKKFQKEYGKTYDKKEAMEVGKKVAGKVYRQQQSMAKGGKTQGYNDRLDESLGNRNSVEPIMKQSFKDRRNESEAMEKKGGKRKYASVKTMDKGSRKKRKTPMTLAKEIRKEGEKWQDAVKRASAMLKKK